MKSQGMAGWQRGRGFGRSKRESWVRGQSITMYHEFRAATEHLLKG